MTDENIIQGEVSSERLRSFILRIEAHGTGAKSIRTVQTFSIFRFGNATHAEITLDAITKQKTGHIRLAAFHRLKLKMQGNTFTGYLIRFGNQEE